MDDYWRKDKKISFSNEDMEWIEDIAGKVKSNFVTVDIARKEDGGLIIMEFGDGQVSRIQQINPSQFYFALDNGKAISI